MNRTDHDILELTTLCNALVDDTLDDMQRVRFAQMLAASEEARRFYVRFVGLSASLHEYAGETQSEVPDNPHIIEMPAWWQQNTFGWTVGVLAAAAAVAVASLLWFTGNDRSTTTVVSAKTESMDTADFVGQVTSTTDCQWTGMSCEPGDELRSGQRLELTKGVVEIVFDSGAQVTLEGPASLVLNSAWNATLRHGELHANVPKAAIGFRISNDVVDVVDLGTQFSMNAGLDGSTEVFVTKGKVETIPKNPVDNEQPSFVLHAEQACQFHRHSHHEMKNSRLKMKWLALADNAVRRSGVARPLRYIHWSFDETNGPVALANAVRFAPGTFDAQLHSLKGSTTAEFRTLGHWGKAMAFDGKTSVHTTIPILADNASRTIAFWVKVPAEASLTEAAPMAFWISHVNEPFKKHATQNIQIGWNTDPAIGTLGALRTKIGHGTVVGATPLRDNTWHHIAVLFTSHNAMHTKFHVKQYVDGRLEGCATQHASKHRHMRTAVTENDTLWLGCTPSEQIQFRGEMDELFIVNAALLPQEIHQLIEVNSLESTVNPVTQTP